MARIGGDRFRAAWYELREAMRDGAEDVEAVTLERKDGKVEMSLRLNPASRLAASFGGPPEAV